MKLKLYVLFLFMFCLLSSSVFAAAPTTEQRVFVKGVRPMGIGGAFIAVADDKNAFFVNPSGITDRQNYSINLLSIDPASGTNFFKLYGFYKENRSDISGFSGLPQEQKISLIKKALNKFLNKPCSIFFAAPSLAFINKPIQVKQNFLNFGIGLFPYGDVVCQIKEHGLLPCLLLYKAYGGVIGIVDIAYKISSLEAIKIPGGLSFGVSFKYIFGVSKVSNEVSVTELLDPKTRKRLFKAIEGFGFDFGMMWHISNCWNVGLSITDIFGTSLKYKGLKILGIDEPKRITRGVIKPNLGLGVAYRPNDKLMFAFDITDTDGAKSTFFKKIHFGCEYKFLKPFVIRVGFNSGYPTAGFGIVTNVVSLEYAFYGEELGRFAGQNAVWSNRIALSLKICGKKRKKDETPPPTPGGEPRAEEAEPVVSPPQSTALGDSLPASGKKHKKKAKKNKEKKMLNEEVARLEKDELVEEGGEEKSS